MGPGKGEGRREEVGDEEGRNEGGRKDGSGMVTENGDKGWGRGGEGEEDEEGKRGKWSTTAPLAQGFARAKAGSAHVSRGTVGHRVSIGFCTTEVSAKTVCISEYAPFLTTSHMKEV